MTTSEARIDLHTHSNNSDGVHAPSALIDLAKWKGISAISLCDHDSLEGYPELEAAARREGIEVLTGVELSCEHIGHDLHVLGYGVDRTSPPLQALLHDFRAARQRRGEQIVEKLAGQGIRIDIEKVMAKAAGGALGRPHIAAALVEAGLVPDFPQAFARYIGEGCPAYVEKYKMLPDEAVAAIHAAGGLAFVAHPGYYLEDEDAFRTMLQRGFDGVEVYHPYHQPAVIKRLLGIASDYNLLISGGSDFHGFAGRDNLGEPAVPYSLLEQIKEALHKRKPS
ncbi:MAG: PHP domain-containing protein [Candidatus Krumholzibacteria bacterium]|nr:PHP domain-containing protein [Candidatus Krumholzibacteria bacterium]MDH4337526.1 PHP domain-containing protein [Candidatus Krumholzibacteria bacterium]MDH5269947.1 PHP domain-containing protein [Candidatus Krumholzibacteria bacterium]